MMVKGCGNKLRTHSQQENRNKKIWRHRLNYVKSKHNIYLMIEIVSTSQTSVSLYETARRRIPEDWMGIGRTHTHTEQAFTALLCIAG
jgi:hypothetical protein